MSLGLLSEIAGIPVKVSKKYFFVSVAILIFYIINPSSWSSCNRTYKKEFPDEEDDDASFFQKVYCYGGKMGWHVPEGFLFPEKQMLDVGWSMWVNGLPSYGSVDETKEEGGSFVSTPVRPFRFIKASLVPSHLRTSFSFSFKVFQMMESSPEITLPKNCLSTVYELQESYKKGLEVFKKQASYIFLNHAVSLNTWTASTWSKHLQRCFIEKEGTHEDISNLPPLTKYNYKRKSKPRRKGKVPTKKTRYTCRRSRITISSSDDNNSDDDSQPSGDAVAQLGIAAVQFPVPFGNPRQKIRRMNAVDDAGKNDEMDLPDMRGEVSVFDLYSPPAIPLDEDGCGREERALTGGANSGGLRNKNRDGENGGNSSSSNRNRLLPNTQDGMVAFGAALRGITSVFSRRVVLLKKRVIKRTPGGALESAKCDKCKRIMSNHYCLLPKEGTGIVLEDGNDDEICGVNHCNLCKGENAENFTKRCIHHEHA